MGESPLSEVRHFVPSQCEVGEGPVWDHRTGRLWWVDIHGHALWWLDEGGDPQHRQFGTTVSAVALTRQDPNRVVIVTGDGIQAWRTAEEPMLMGHPEPDRQGARMNDAKVDSQGRLWVGTMSTELPVDRRSSLYRMDSDHSIVRVAGSLGVANGIGWNLDDDRMYLADSAAGLIYAFQFDSESGRVRDQQVFATINDRDGRPDGLAVDVSGVVWCALWGGSAIRKFAPDGRVIGDIAVPVSHPTSCAFVGPSLSTLVVTSARRPLDRRQRAVEQTAGDVFAFDVDMPGVSIGMFGD